MNTLNSSWDWSWQVGGDGFNSIDVDRAIALNRDSARPQEIFPVQSRNFISTSLADNRRNAHGNHANDAMNRLSKINSRRQRTAYGTGIVALALPFIGIGSYLILACAGYFPFPVNTDTPFEVIAATGGVFAFAGTLLLEWGVRLWIIKRRLQRAERSHPNQPWRADFPWNTQCIRDEADRRVFQIALIVALLAAFLVPFNTWAFLSSSRTLSVQVVAGVFDVLWILVALALAYHTRRFARYGFTTLTLARFPFHPGEKLTVGVTPNRFARFDAILRFVEEHDEPRDGDAHRSAGHLLYEHFRAQQTIHANPSAESVPIEFPLPNNPAWTNQLRATPRVCYWELVIKATQPSIDFQTAFVLPVYPDTGFASVSNRLFAHAKIRSGRDAHKWSLERKAILAPAFILAILAVVWPNILSSGVDGIERLWHRFSTRRAIVPVTDISTHPVQLHADTAGNVWVLTQYELTRLDPNALGHRDTLLDPLQYQATFKRRMDPLSSVIVLGADDVWVGGWYGQILHFRNGSWQEILTREQSTLGRIYQIIRYGDSLYFAAQGLWRWDAESASMQQISLVPSRATPALLALNESELLVASDNTLGKIESGLFTALWQADQATIGAINSIAVASNGDVILGCDRGVVTIDPTGKQKNHELVDIAVSRLRYDDTHQLWVATRRHGIRVRHGEAWASLDVSAGLPANDINDIFITSNKVWLATYSEGVSVAITSSLLPVKP